MVKYENTRIRRNRIYEPSYFAHVGSKSEILCTGRWIDKGCENPEHDCFENKMPSCASCNINKHSDNLEQFRANIKSYMKHLNEINTQFKIAKRYGLVTENDIEVIFYFELNPAPATITILK